MRLRVHFTLRGLLLFVTALGVSAGLGQYLARQLRADIDAVEALGRVADVQYRLIPKWPQWIHRVGGDRARQYWTDVDQLSIECTTAWNVALVNKSARDWHKPSIVTPDFRGRGVQPRSSSAEIAANAREQARLFVELLDECPRLRTLSLNGDLIDDKSLEAIARFELPITWLELRNTSIRGTGLAFLQRLSQLKKLVLSDSDYDGKGLEELAKVRSLLELDFRASHDSAVCCAAIGKLKQLDILVLDLPMAVDQDLDPIFGLVQLHTLALHVGDGIVGEGWNWDENSQLRSLFINGDCMTDAALVHLDRMQHLETLTLWGDRVVGEQFSVLESLPRLKTFNLSASTLLCDEALESIGRLKHLEEFDCFIPRATSHRVAQLAKLRPSKVRELRIKPLNVTRPQLDELAAWPGGVTLFLPDSMYSSQDASALLTAHPSWQVRVVPADTFGTNDPPCP